jgi:hypothetical protein
MFNICLGNASLQKCMAVGLFSIIYYLHFKFCIITYSAWSMFQTAYVFAKIKTFVFSFPVMYHDSPKIVVIINL